jgi:hypothetical protein
VYLTKDGNVNKSEDTTSVPNNELKIAEVDVAPDDTISAIRNVAFDAKRHVASETSPVSSTPGDLWFDLSNDRIKTRQSGEYKLIATEQDTVSIEGGDGLTDGNSVSLVGGEALSLAVNVSDLAGPGLQNDGSNKLALDTSSITEGGSNEIDVSEFSGADGDSGQILRTDGDSASWYTATDKVTYVTSTTPSSASEGETWYDTSNGRLLIYADLGNGLEWHSVPPITVTEEAATFTESNVTVTHNNTEVSAGDIRLEEGNEWDYGSYTQIDSVSVNYNSVPDNGGRLADNGEYFYLTGDGLYQYTISTAFDISTLDPNGTNVTDPFELDARGFDVGPNGENVLTASSSGRLNNFTLSTPWDMTTATKQNEIDLENYSYNLSGADALAMSPDGTQLIIAGVEPANDHVIESYELSTPFDVSTISSYTGRENTENSYVVNDVFSIEFGNDGQYLYLSDRQSSDNAARWQLYDKYSLSGGVFEESGGNPGRIATSFSDNGRYLYDSDGSTIYKYQADPYTKLSGDALVEWDTGRPDNINSYDLATFQRNLYNETVTIDVEDGNGNTLFSDISRNFDISTIDTNKNVKLRVNLSRNSTDNFPSVQYLARRYTR